jgi:hypothetical protein
MGLLMAMAGIDYSNLREPDYLAQNFKESERTMAYLEKLVESQLATFRNRQEQIDRNRKKHGDVFTHNERIFYDTDYIDERQNTRLVMCPDCAGLRTIDSTAQHRDGRTYRVFCISITGHACPKCQAKGIKNYQDMVKNSAVYDYIYLQNRVNDEFRSYDLKRGLEKVL